MTYIYDVSLWHLFIGVCLGGRNWETLSCYVPLLFMWPTGPNAWSMILWYSAGRWYLVDRLASISQLKGNSRVYHGTIKSMLDQLFLKWWSVYVGCYVTECCDGTEGWRVGLGRVVRMVAPLYLTDGHFGTPSLCVLTKSTWCILKRITEVKLFCSKELH